MHMHTNSFSLPNSFIPVTLCSSVLFHLFMPLPHPVAYLTTFVIKWSRALPWILHTFLTSVCLLLSFTPSQLCYKAVISAVQCALPPLSPLPLSALMPLPVTPASFTMSLHPPPLRSLSLSNKAINSTLHAYFTPSNSLSLCVCSPSVSPTVSLCRDETSKAALLWLINLSLSLSVCLFSSATADTSIHIHTTSQIKASLLFIWHGIYRLFSFIMHGFNKGIFSFLDNAAVMINTQERTLYAHYM